jgi:chemotaxis protein CheX
MSENGLALLDRIMPRFRESLKQTFETMVFMPVEWGEALPKGLEIPGIDISGTIGLTGTGLCGSLSLAFPSDLAQVIFRSMMMMGADDPVDGNELRDAVGELANMVAGGAKAKLQDDGVDCVIGLPTVVVGESHHLAFPGDVKVCALPINVAKGIFYMSLGLA